MTDQRRTSRPRRWVRDGWTWWDRMPLMPVIRRVAALLAVPLLLGGLVACSHQPSPDPAVSAFLDGWRTGQFKADLPLISGDGAQLAGADVAAKIKALSGDLATLKP